MSFSNRVSQTLHEEHRATIALMEELESFIRRHHRAIPNISDGLVSQFIARLGTSIEAEIERHFDFEERHLFSYLKAIGDAEIGAHLTEEHVAMRPLGRRLAAIARSARTANFDEPSWREFQGLGQEFCERMLAHVQKEEMALLPILEESMDSNTEAALYQAYVEERTG